MFFAIFRKFLGLYFCLQLASFGQQIDNAAVIELGQSNFPIERPFVITVTIPNSDTRPVLTFPEIAGFVKKGTSASVTTTEVGSKFVTNQIITQNYQARAPGRYRLPPFVMVINGTPVRSEGAELVVSSSLQNPPPAPVVPSGNAAFLQLQTSKSAIYAGEGVDMTLSFFVADNYPYELSFTALDKQLQTIVKQIRPVNAWEENWNITDLKPSPVLIAGKKYRQYQLYRAEFFPLAVRPLRIPAVTLQLTQTRPATTQPEPVSFTSRPVAVDVRALPAHPLRGRVPVGLFRLEEGLSRQRVGLGQSVRYSFAIAGEGNIATLPDPVTTGNPTELEVFPPESRHVINRTGDRITGRKSFSYFLVPHRNGPVALANQFQWIYFDPQRARYDTLRSRLQLLVGGRASLNTTADAATDTLPADRPTDASGGRSLYAGIDALDSTEQPIQVSALIRAIANVLIVLMLLGMIFVFFRK